MSGVKYERDGYPVPAPKGHKREGWRPFKTVKGHLWGNPLRGTK